MSAVPSRSGFWPAELYAPWLIFRQSVKAGHWTNYIVAARMHTDLCQAVQVREDVWWTKVVAGCFDSGSI